MKARPSKELRDLYRRFAGRCYYCRKPTELTCRQHPLQATRDHLITEKCSNRHDPANIVLACFGCNQARGITSADIFEMAIPALGAADLIN